MRNGHPVQKKNPPIMFPTTLSMLRDNTTKQCYIFRLISKVPPAGVRGARFARETVRRRHIPLALRPPRPQVLQGSQQEVQGDLVKTSC